MLTKANNIEAILGSLDEVKRAEAPPFLYRKIRAKLNSPKPGILVKLDKIISRPAIAISFLFFILFVDGIVFRSTFKSVPEKFENSAEYPSSKDDFEEILFYDTLDGEYAFIY